MVLTTHANPLAAVAMGRAIREGLNPFYSWE